VREKFYLREVRELHPWAKVRADLEDGAVLRDNEHYELVFSPYARKRAYPCLVTTRNAVSDPRNRMWDKRMRNFAVELAAKIPFTSRVLSSVLHMSPRLSPMLLEVAMTALVKNQYDELSYKVFNIGNANLVPALSAEVGVPMDGRHIAAVERIFEVADEYRRLCEIYQSSPISLRFVKDSPAYMSMMWGVDTMMIELIQLNGNTGSLEPTRRRCTTSPADRTGASSTRLRAATASSSRCTPATPTGRTCTGALTQAASSTARSPSGSASRPTASRLSAGLRPR